MALNKITANPIMAGLVATGFLLVPLGIPLLAPLQLAIPLPLLLVALRCGSRAGWQAVALLLVSAALAGGGLLLPTLVFLLFASFPLLAAWLLRLGWKTSHCATVAFLLGGLVLGVTLTWAVLTGVDLPAQFTVGMTALKDELLASLATTPGLDALALAEFRQNLERFIALVALLFPAFLLTGWFLVQVANLLLVRFFVNRWQENRIFPENMTDLRLPFPLVWVVIIMGLLALFAQGPLYFFGANLGMFLVIPYFFQGLAIILRAFQFYNIGGFARGAVLATLFFWTGMAMLVLLLGLFDTWMDFRHRFLPNKEGNDSSER